MNRNAVFSDLGTVAERPLVFSPGDGLRPGYLYVETDGSVWLVRQNGAGVRSWFSLAGGGGGTGDPNTLAWFGPSGVLTDSVRLVVRQVGLYTRPEIWDARIPDPGGAGPVYRQGAWQTDGDPFNLPGDGLVIYGPSINGILNSGEGAFARIKSNRFALRQIFPGFDGDLWHVDPSQMYYMDNGGNFTWRLTRTTGTIDTAGNVHPFNDDSGELGWDAARWHRVRSRVANFSGYTAATLPAGVEGEITYCTDGRKQTEPLGPGTGCPVYWSAKGGGGWFCFGTDLPVVGP